MCTSILRTVQLLNIKNTLLLALLQIHEVLYRTYDQSLIDQCIFRMFELKCSIPLEKDLEIRVMDYNALLADEGNLL